MRVKGGGHTSQVYAIRQAIAKALVAYYAKYIDAYSSLELKKKLVAYDRTLLIADPRRMEPKKFGGGGARARRQKRYDRISLISAISLILTFITGQLSLSLCLYFTLFCYVIFNPICHHAYIVNVPGLGFWKKYLCFVAWSLSFETPEPVM